MMLANHHYILANCWCTKKMMAAQLQLGKDRIRNAIDVWRDYLTGELFVINGEKIVV